MGIKQPSLEKRGPDLTRRRASAESEVVRSNPFGPDPAGVRRRAEERLDPCYRRLLNTYEEKVPHVREEVTAGVVSPARHEAAGLKPMM